MQMFLGVENLIWQNLILLLTALITLYIYRRKNIISLKNAAKLIILQIKDIEKNIEYLKIEAITQNRIINEQQMYNSVTIYEQNFWNDYRHQLFNYLSSDDYELISKFYDNATMIKRFQNDIKNFILTSLQYRGIDRCHLLLIYTLMSNDNETLQKDINNKISLYDRIVTSSYVPYHYGESISTYLSTYQRISGTTAYRSLIKMSKRKF